VYNVTRGFVMLHISIAITHSRA